MTASVTVSKAMGSPGTKRSITRNKRFQDAKALFNFARRKQGRPATRRAPEQQNAFAVRTPRAIARWLPDHEGYGRRGECRWRKGRLPGRETQLAKRAFVCKALWDLNRRFTKARWLGPSDRA